MLCPLSIILFSPLLFQSVLPSEFIQLKAHLRAKEAECQVNLLLVNTILYAPLHALHDLFASVCVWAQGVSCLHSQLQTASIF